MERTTVTSRSSLAFALFLGSLLLFSGASAGHHNKNKDADALTQCTIESSGGGGGCAGIEAGLSETEKWRQVLRLRAR
jgi:hypothetical protein